MSQSNIPYLTVIGNHDHLSNGALIYQQMFGALNYTFTFSEVNFIAWDNTIWESNKEADYEWLETTLQARDESAQSLNHTIVLSHVPPFDKQLIPKADLFHGLLRDQGIKLSVHGHKHEFFFGKLFDDEVEYLTVGSPQNRSYAELVITPDKITVHKITY